jgi:hypothetical protein
MMLPLRAVSDEGTVGVAVSAAFRGTPPLLFLSFVLGEAPGPGSLSASRARSGGVGIVGKAFVHVGDLVLGIRNRCGDLAHLFGEVLGS